MRVGDIAPPALELDELPPGAPIATWPYRPVIALERLPDAAYVWDDTDPAVVWDGIIPDNYVPGYLNLAAGYAQTVDTPDMSVSDGPFRVTYRGRVDTSPATGYPSLLLKQGTAGITEREFYLYVSAATAGQPIFASATNTTGTAPAFALQNPLPFGAEHTIGVEIYPGSTKAVAIVDDVRTPGAFPTPIARLDTPAAVRVGSPTAGYSGRIYWAQLEAIQRARLVFPGVAGNYLSIPHAAGQVPTGDLEVVARVSLADWNLPTGIVLTKNGSWYFLVAGYIALWSTTAGGSTYPQSTAHGFAPGATGWVKATRVAATGVTSFYSAPDSPTEPTTWTARGTSTGPTGPLSVPTQPVQLGQYATSGSPLKGRVLRAIMRNGIGGPIVVDVRENDAGTMATATTFVASSGQTVTVTQTTGNTIVQPQPDRVVWRFDADDYPGTGTSYVDPRGRTWTLSTAGAIVPKVGDPYVWDAPFIGAGFTDAVCDFHAVDIDPGDADDLYLFPATQCTVTLDNRAGTYTPWSADGRLVYWAPGRRLHVWVVDAQGEPWWLFSGRVASWTLNADDTVTVTAFDGFAALAQELGGVWTPGVAGQTVQARYGAIVAAAAYPDPVDVEAGTVTLTAPELDADTSPLMALQRVALSDGGIVYADADGAIDYRARTWRAGRDDQAATWVVSDNVCTVPVVVWDAELAADDDRLATDVHLVNTADPPLVATAAATESVWAGDARYHLTHPDPDQWTTQLEGDDLAAYLIAQQSTPSMALSRFALYALDRRQPAVFDMVTGARRGDRVEVLHEYPDADGNPAILDTFAIALGVGHAITPESWVADVALSRTVDYRPVESWDWTRFTWDEDDPANVWRF